MALAAGPIPAVMAHFVPDALNVRDDPGRPTVCTRALNKFTATVFFIAFQATRKSTRVVGVDEFFNARRVRVALRRITHNVVGPTLHARRTMALVGGCRKPSSIVKGYVCRVQTSSQMI
jgi:hypothetical protein